LAIGTRVKVTELGAQQAEHSPFWARGFGAERESSAISALAVVAEPQVGEEVDFDWTAREAFPREAIERSRRAGHWLKR